MRAIETQAKPSVYLYSNEHIVWFCSNCEWSTLQLCPNKICDCQIGRRGRHELKMIWKR